MNNITLVGRAGGDPEMKYTESGTTIARFSLAVDRGKDKQGNKQTDWFTIKLFGKTAEVAGEYVTKGKQIAISGKMVNEKYTNKETGEKRDYWNVQGDRLELLGDAKGGGEGKGGAAAADDEIPF